MLFLPALAYPGAPSDDFVCLMFPRVCLITMPSADSCTAICAPLEAPSPDSGTRRRSPRVSPAAFSARPPDLRLRPPDGTGLRDPLLARPVLAPRIRFLFIGPRFCSTLPSDDTSRRRRCASLPLRFRLLGRGLSPPRCWTCLAHNKAGPTLSSGAGCWDQVEVARCSAACRESWPLVRLPERSLAASLRPEPCGSDRLAPSRVSGAPSWGCADVQRTRVREVASVLVRRTRQALSGAFRSFLAHLETGTVAPTSASLPGRSDLDRVPPAAR